MTTTVPTAVETGAILDIPLNKLKASPRNARRVPHSEAAIAALAASIAAKTMLQAPVVEPELDGEGVPTGFYFVTIGEGRRQAQMLRAKNKEIAKTTPIRCVVDTEHDPHEISLDENVTRTDMHPADQFEAFRRLAEERGFGAEEIAARFGVSAHVVRQRLRLGAVAPELMAAYRDGDLTLDQLMAFAVTEDHDRQRQVFEQLVHRAPHAIRRAMTETKVAASDRRVAFVGVEAYAEAGGAILRDLFTEDGGGWLEDVGLLDRLTAEKLDTLAVQIRDGEGWNWAQAHLDYPHGHGLRRVYPQPVERPEAQVAAITALAEEYDALVDQWDSVEDLPPEIEARFKEIDAALEAFGDDHAYLSEDRARGGVLVVLGHDGQARVERGLIRPEDEAPAPPAEPDVGAAGAGATEVGVATGDENEDTEPEGIGPLSERLVLDLTAHRTAGLRDALAEAPHLALTAVVHALALRSFYAPYDQLTCLEIKAGSVSLEGHAPGLGDSPAARRIAERHAAWAQRLPREASEAWVFVTALDATELLALLAHCASQTINAVHVGYDRRPGAWRHADTLAVEAGLDMTRTWTVTGESYLSRVTKPHILEAVRDGVSPEAAERMDGLKKAETVEAAEIALAGTGWLPPLLRTASPAVEEPSPEAEPGEVRAA